jgi:hypothetical protein
LCREISTHVFIYTQWRPLIVRACEVVLCRMPGSHQRRLCRYRAATRALRPRPSPLGICHLAAAGSYLLPRAMSIYGYIRGLGWTSQSPSTNTPVASRLCKLLTSVASSAIPRSFSFSRIRAADSAAFFFFASRWPSVLTSCALQRVRLRRLRRGGLQSGYHAHPAQAPTQHCQGA